VAAGRGIIDEFEDDSDEAEEPAVEDPGWSRSLRGVGRVGAWALPLAAVGLGVSALWGWPQPGVNSDRPGTWLILTIAALGLGLLGVLAVGALLAATPGRRWAVLGGAATLAGTTLLAPVLGVVALARPAVTNASAQLGDEAARAVNLIDGRVARWLLVGGLALLVVGVSATGVAVVASGVLAPFDGYLLIGGVAVAVFAAWASLQFVLVIAAMVLLAGALGLAWTASRITPDGRGPDLD
jgi:hypothetical protein